MKPFLELGGCGRAAIGEQRLFQIFEAHGQLGQTGQCLLDGCKKFLRDFIGQFLGVHELLEHFFLRRFEQLEIALDDGVGEVVEEALGPTFVNLFQIGFSGC